LPLSREGRTECPSLTSGSARSYPPATRPGDRPSSVLSTVVRSLRGRATPRRWSPVPEVDVRLVDVVKRFGDTAAVDHINLEVQDGEFFSLLGPPGWGKTTPLGMIGGFEQPPSGLIELQGQDVTWLPPYKRNVNT